MGLAHTVFHLILNAFVFQGFGSSDTYLYLNIHIRMYIYVSSL